MTFFLQRNNTEVFRGFTNPKSFFTPIYPISIPSRFFRIRSWWKTVLLNCLIHVFPLITLQQKSPSFNKLYMSKRTEAGLLILFPTMVMSFSRGTSRDKQLLQFQHSTQTQILKFRSISTRPFSIFGLFYKELENQTFWSWWAVLYGAFFKLYQVFGVQFWDRASANPPL